MNVKVILSLVFLVVLAQSNFTSSFCTVKDGATNELVINLAPSKESRDPQEIIYYTQGYTSGGKPVTVSHIQVKDDIILEETNSKLETFIHKEDVTNKLIFIDSWDNLILTKEITDEQKGDIKYLLFEATLGANSTMKKSPISATVDDAAKDISDMSLRKILAKTATDIYFVLVKEDKTSVYKTAWASPKDLTFVADVADKQLSVGAGNEKYLFVDTQGSQTFYELSGATYTEKTFADLGIDAKIDKTKLTVTYMDNGLFILSSFTAGSTNIIPVDATGIDAAKIVTLKGEAVVYSDNYKDFIAVASDDFVWLSQSAAAGSTKSAELKKAVTNATLSAQILSAFSEAKYVSFDSGNALVLSKSTSTKKGNLTIVNFDGTTFTVKEQIGNAFSFKKGPFKDLENPKAVGNYESTLACNCVTYVLSKFECFASGMKCITTTSPKKEDCTVKPA